MTVLRYYPAVLKCFRKSRSTNPLLKVPALVLALLVLSSAARSQWISFKNSDDIRALYKYGDTLWIGTNGGLILYDLLEEKTVKKLTISEGLLSNSIRVIAGKGSSIYVGTDGGMSVFKGPGGDLDSKREGRHFSAMRHISFGPDGTIDIGTFGHGATVLRNGSIQVITKSDSLLADKVYSVYRESRDTTYFGTSMGLCAFRDSAWVSFQAGYGIPRGEVKSLLPSGDGYFYVLVAGRGIYLFDGRRARRLPLEDRFKENDIAAITLSPDKALWAAGRYGGIGRYQYGTWMMIEKSDPEVSRTKWRCAYADELGNVYFGSSDGLVVSVESGSVLKRRIHSLLPSNSISAFAQDSSSVLIASGGMILKWRGDGFEEESAPGSILGMAVAPDGSLWCSTRWGVFKRDDGRFRDASPEFTGLRTYFLAITFDNDGNLWAGSFLGDVYEFDGKIWMPCGYRDEIFGGPIDDITVDGEGRVWVLSRNAGVSEFNGVTWHNYPISMFGTDHINAIVLDNHRNLIVLGGDRIWKPSDEGGWVERSFSSGTGEFQTAVFDGEGRVYIGTDYGLVLVSGQVVRMIKPENGLGGRAVASMFIDRENNLWIGFHHSGVSRVPIDSLW
jgi:ligand-binding sensor domain-containing protein